MAKRSEIKTGPIIPGLPDVNKERLVSLFMELVQIDSVSRKERKMVDRIKEIFSGLGFSPVEDRAGKVFGGNAGNLIMDIPGQEGLPTLLLSAHLDRVEPGLGIKPVIKDGYIMSSGDTVLAGDDIIGVAAIIEAVRELQENKITHCPLKLVFTVAEEVGLLGAQELSIEEVKSIDYGLVFDVDGDIGTIVFKAPSQIKFNAVIRGKAAHAGINPGEGINAIKISSKAISDMKLGQVDEETTANIGVIRGGRAINIVPDLVELEGEVRSHRESSLENQVQHMQMVIDKAVCKYGGEVDYQIERLYSGFELPLESDIINLVKKSIIEMGLKPEFTASGGGSDANIYNERGLPTINLGVGMEKVHSTEERVKVKSLVELVELIIRIIKNVGV